MREPIHTNLDWVYDSSKKGYAWKNVSYVTKYIYENDADVKRHPLNEFMNDVDSMFFLFGPTDPRNKYYVDVATDIENICKASPEMLLKYKAALSKLCYNGPLSYRLKALRKPVYVVDARYFYRKYTKEIKKVLSDKSMAFAKANGKDPYQDQICVDFVNELIDTLNSVSSWNASNAEKWNIPQMEDCGKDLDKFIETSDKYEAETQRIYDREKAGKSF